MVTKKPKSRLVSSWGCEGCEGVCEGWQGCEGMMGVRDEGTCEDGKDVRDKVRWKGVRDRRYEGWSEGWKM